MGRVDGVCLDTAELLSGVGWSVMGWGGVRWGKVGLGWVG